MCIAEFDYGLLLLARLGSARRRNCSSCEVKNATLGISLNSHSRVLAVRPHRTALGRATSRGSTRDRSRPSSRTQSCAADSFISPSSIGGHLNRPLSSRFVIRQMPVPSHQRSLMRSILLERTEGARRGWYEAFFAANHLPRGGTRGAHSSSSGGRDRCNHSISFGPKC
jgi:hypothetical protein